MSRLIWMLLGVMGGIIISRNSIEMTGPEKGAVGLAFIVACGLCWFAAYRGKSEAVAVAIATATATANSEAEAHAAAIAQQAVNVYYGVMPPQNDAIENIANGLQIPSIRRFSLVQEDRESQSREVIRQLQTQDVDMRDDRG